MATKKDSYDRVIEKLNRLEDRLADFEATITISLLKLEKAVEEDSVTKQPKKAKDLPIGTKVTLYSLVGNEPTPDDVYTVIAHSRTCDDVVVVENDSGDISAENVNDLDILEG